MMVEFLNTLVANPAVLRPWWLLNIAGLTLVLFFIHYFVKFEFLFGRFCLFFIMDEPRVGDASFIKTVIANKHHN